MSRIFVDGEPFSRAHRHRAWGLIRGWTWILGLIFYRNREPSALVRTELDDVEERAVELIDMHFRKVKGRLIYAPDALAASALYIACVENNLRKATQQLIANLAGRTEVWVRNNYKKLWKELELHDTAEVDLRVKRD